MGSTHMRILFVSHKFPPHALAGVEVYTYHLAQTLRRQHEVTVFYRHDDRDGPPFAEHDGDTDGVPTRRVSLSPSGLKASVAGEFFDTFLNRQIEQSFSRFVAQFQPDLIHFQHVMALSARLLGLARQAGVPVVLTLHDYWFICSNSQLIWPDAQTCRGKAWGMNCVRCAAAARFPSPLVPWLRPFLAPLFLYRDRVAFRAALEADQLISPSHFLLDQYAGAGLPAERLRYLEYGIPVERIRRAPWRSSDGPVRIAFVGSLAWQKGVHVLAEAFNGLPAGVARLRIWGDPTIFPGYAKRLRRQLTHPDAELMGRVDNERVGEVLADSDVLVVPSVWYENSPLVIHEARAAGVPVVASGHGALVEKVRDGVDGLLFPPGDAGALRRTLLRLIDEPGLLSRLRQASQPPPDISIQAQHLEAIYRQLLAQKGRAL
jgi:glycosyltransferase involved in cell wall biosynthesis